MFKRKRYWIVAVGLAVFIGGAVVASCQEPVPDVQRFDVDGYRYYIETFPSEENLGPISDTKVLLEKVEEVWVGIYGEQIKKEKPYQVSYDEKNGVWLVQGTLPADRMGGVAYILVEDDTGDVLAVWHDK